MIFELYPLNEWAKANTNLLLIALNKKTRKYSQYLVHLDTEEALVVKYAEDLQANTAKFLALPTGLMQNLFAVKLPGHENYFYQLKIFENDEQLKNLPHLALVAESAFNFFKHKEKIESTFGQNGYLICEQASQVAAPRLSDAVLSEPQLQRDVIRCQTDLFKLMRNYINIQRPTIRHLELN